MTSDTLDAAYLASIVESSDDAIIGKDLSGVVRSWNRGAEVIFGYGASEMIGASVKVLFPPDRVAEEEVILSRIRAGQRVEHHETVRRRKDGTEFPASVTISPIRAAGGQIVGASKIVRDISERHRAQTALLKAKTDLEAVLVERTAALAQRDLLLREVYHRVKNNLQVVDGLLMLQAVKMTDPAARDVLMGLRARVLALGLVHQQLMGSADLMTFDAAPFLHELLTNIIGGAADDRVTITVDASPLDVGLDFAVPLGLLVTELVTNSLKHAFQDRAGTIAVALRPNGKGAVVLTVSDNGCGFTPPPAIGASSGLGASLVRRLATQLGGEVVVRHERGTTTEVCLPLPEAA